MPGIQDLTVKARQIAKKYGMGACALGSSYCYMFSPLFGNQFSVKVPAKQLVQDAVASEIDRDVLCNVLYGCARGRERDAERKVFSVLKKNGLSLPTTISEVEIGEGDLLAHFPCIRPADLITAMRDIGHLDKVAGLPMDTCSSQMINEQRVYSNLFFSI